MGNNPLEKYFTLKVVLIDKQEIVYKNLTQQHCEKIKAEIWVRGIVQQTNRTTQRLIKPWIIEDVYLVEQNEWVKQ